MLGCKNNNFSAVAIRDYTSVEQLKGSVSQRHAIDPGAYERANYIQVLDSYTRPPGVLG